MASQGDENGTGVASGGATRAWLRFERVILLNLATGLAIFATLIMLMEAFSRGFLSHSYFWAEESVRYLMIWAFFLTIGCAGRAGHMIRTEILVERLPPAIRQVCSLISTGLGVMFAAILLYASIPQVLRYRSMGMMTESNLDLPMWLLFMAMPIGALLMGLYYVGAFLTTLRGRDPYAQADAGGGEEMKGPLL